MDIDKPIVTGLGKRPSSIDIRILRDNLALGGPHSQRDHQQVGDHQVVAAAGPQPKEQDEGSQAGGTGTQVKKTVYCVNLEDILIGIWLEDNVDGGF